MGDVAAKNTQTPSALPGIGGPGFKNPYGGTTGSSKKPLSFEQAYPAAVEQTGEDYDSIMGGYQKLLDSEGSSNNGLVQNYQSILNRNKAAPANVVASTAAAPSRVDPALQTYLRDPNVISSLASLKDLTDMGGYSEQGIADLRARGVSPIRSIYANSMRDMERNRAIQGGYSPNYNASTSRMTRELADQISGATQNVNAGIAQNVASNRLSAAPQYASAAGRESEAEQVINAANVAAKNRAGEVNAGATNTTNQLNTAAKNRANEFNTTNTLDMNKFNSGLDLQTLEALRALASENQGNKTKALEGMASLYGTTPALANTFGNQAATAAQIKQSATQANNQTGLGLINATIGSNRTTQSSGYWDKKPTSSYIPFQSPGGKNAKKTLPPWAYG